MAGKRVLVVIILILLNWFSCDAASGGTRDQVNGRGSLLLDKRVSLSQIVLANFKAQLSKARTLKQALAIYADSSMNNRHQVAMQRRFEDGRVLRCVHV